MAGRTNNWLKSEIRSHIWILFVHEKSLYFRKKKEVEAEK